MIHMALLPWLWHPLGACSAGPEYEACRSYNWWSGIEGNLPYIISIIAAALAIWRFLHQHFECHVEGCHKLGLHHVEHTPHRTCWIHHPVLGGHEHHGVPLHVLHGRHHAATADEADQMGRNVGGSQ